MKQTLGRLECAILQNKSGGALAQGDVCIVDDANAEAITTTTTSGYTSGRIGVILDLAGIEDEAFGLVVFAGYVPKINLSGTGNIGDVVKTHTVAGQGVRHAAPFVAGDFAQVLGTSASPSALLFGVPVISGSASKGVTGITKLRKTAVQNIATGAWRTITWDAEDYDNLDAFDSGTSTSNITVPTGITLAKVALFTCWANNSTSGRYINLKNNANEKSLLFDIKNALNESGGALSAGWIPVTAGDVYSLQVNSGSQTLDFGDATYPATYPQLTIEWLDDFSSLHV